MALHYHPTILAGNTCKGCNRAWQWQLPKEFQQESLHIFFLTRYLQILYQVMGRHSIVGYRVGHSIAPGVEYFILQTEMLIVYMYGHMLGQKEENTVPKHRSFDKLAF